MSSFDENRMPANIAAGAVGGPMFSTSVYQLSGGSEYRNQNWLYPLHQWTLTHWMDAASDFATMKNWFWSHFGKAIGFRFQDLMDYQVTSYQQFGTGDGSQTQFQLTKAYSTASRLIKKPVSGTLGIKVSGTPIVEGAGAGKFTCDYTTGIITFGTAPSAAAPITWIGQFDVPVRFDTDQFAATHETANTSHLDGLTIVELRNP
jgi:uncharacterized protein (TIGR02217 family)